MKDFIFKLFRNSSQKVIWVLGLVVLSINWVSVNIHNGSPGSCLRSGYNCWNVLDRSIVILLFFTIFAQIFNKEKR